MIPEQLRIGDSAQRRPPELRFEALFVDAIDQRFHIGVAMWELLGVDGPLAVVVLPTIVQGYPGETHFLDRRKRVVDLLELDRTPVAPCAPDRAKGAVGR